METIYRKMYIHYWGNSNIDIHTPKTIKLRNKYRSQGRARLATTDTTRANKNTRANKAKGANKDERRRVNVKGNKQKTPDNKGSVASRLPAKASTTSNRYISREKLVTLDDFEPVVVAAAEQQRSSHKTKDRKNKLKVQRQKLKKHFKKFSSSK